MKMIIFIILIAIPTLGFSQIENRWQPDSVYQSHKVKKIHVYMNSPKDLSEIVEFDKSGKKIKIEKYSASYNKKTRKIKSLDHIFHLVYDENGLLIKELDSTIYYSGEFSINKKIFEYDSINRLKAIKYYQRDFPNPNRVMTFHYNPLRTIYKRTTDSIVVYQETKEYDYDFYVKRSFGYSLNPKLKKEEMKFYDENDSLVMTDSVQYSDYEDYERKEINTFISNVFDSDERLLKSLVEYVSENKRKTLYELEYKYFKSGLLKSIQGYVPRYFKYEYWE